MNSTSTVLEIYLENIGKKFGREWIFRNLDISFCDSSRYAIIGGNGSGKSTLLQIVSGFLSCSEGNVRWSQQGKEIPFEKLFRHVTLCTPLLSLYDDLTLDEQVDLWCKFRSLKQDMSIGEFADRIELSKHRNKKLRNFSSGMRQRVKLGLAILTESDILLLDEPVSHLDANAINWFQELLKTHAGNRSLFVASNSIQDEFFLCEKSIDIQEYKKTNQTS